MITMTDFTASISPFNDNWLWKADLREIIPLNEPEEGCHQGKIVHELILNRVLFPRNTYSYNSLTFFIEFRSIKSANAFLSRLQKYLDEKWGQNL